MDKSTIWKFVYYWKGVSDVSSGVDVDVCVCVCVSQSYIVGVFIHCAS